jgi:hypothetical protein
MNAVGACAGSATAPWHIAKHLDIQGDSPAGVTAQRKGDEPWIDLPWDSRAR